MESEHTPGPWKLREGVPLDLLRDHDVLESSAKAVVYSEYRDSCGNWVAREVAVCVPSVADARLIAAAPELLECLKEAVETFLGYAAIHFNKHTLEGDQKAEWNARQAAKYWAVVQKAQGEQ